MPEPRDVPEGFVRGVMNMEGGGYASLAREWDAGMATVRRWLVETNLLARVENPPVPKSWGDIAPTKHRIELSKHYCVPVSVIARWVRETHVEPKQKKKPVTLRGELRERAAVKYSGSKHLEAAADCLRRFFSNVHRADIYITNNRTWGQARGLPDKGRGQYYIDSVGVVTSEQMLKLAREHGHEAGRV